MPRRPGRSEGPPDKRYDDDCRVLSLAIQRGAGTCQLTINERFTPETLTRRRFYTKFMMFFFKKKQNYFTLNAKFDSIHHIPQILTISNLCYFKLHSVAEANFYYLIKYSFFFS